MSPTKHNETDIYPVIIFLPNQYEKCERGYLYGEVVSDDLLKSTNFFIHEVNDQSTCNPHDNIIGTIGDEYYPIKKRKKKENWVKLTVDKNMPQVLEVVHNHVECRQVACQIMIYDKTRFLKTELMSQVDSDCETDDGENVFIDHFKLLDYSLKHRQLTSRYPSDLPVLVKLILLKFMFCLTVLDKIIKQLHPLLTFSSLINHMYMFVKSAIWGLGYIMRKKSITSLKIGNYILGLIGDWFGGMMLIFWILSIMSVEDVLQTLAVQSEVVVVALRDTVEYLMGSPADLKLNGPLNNVLGRFFLFHIDLWWAFLGFSRPLLELGFRLFLCLGSLGLSFQLAILTDLLTIATFHIYVIYVYAAKLYHAQVVGLASLSRVFLGRKRNPLPGRVDSCPYSTEQLLIGTIAFTVLLFLLPTTLVYYIVFTAMRLMIIGVAGLVMQASFVLRALPLYSIVLWMCNSPATASCVRLRPIQCTPDQCVLEASPVQGPWWPSVRSGSPFRPTPSSVPWRELCCHVLTGTLLYPV